MLVSPNGSAAKKDLHVGGVGASPATVLASVIDPLMKQKILLARQMLGKDTVDDEDLWSLERQGAFSDLKVSPADSAAAAAAAANRPAPGPPPAQQTPTNKGPQVPKSTSEQAAPANGGGGSNASNGK